MIEALRERARQVEGVLRAQDWKGPRGMGLTKIVKTFGTWNAALEAAGL